jgi:hypothetical protein
VTHIEDSEQHDYLESCFHEEEFLDPVAVNQKLELPHKLGAVQKTPGRSFNFLLPLVRANTIFPILIWKNLRSKIEEEEFIATYKFALGMTVVPVFYGIQSLAVGYFFGAMTGWIYLGLSLLIVFLLTKSR